MRARPSFTRTDRRAFTPDRDVSSYFIAAQATRLASAIEDTAVGWQIYSIHHRAIDLGLIGLVMFAPQLLLAIPAGSIADRFDRRAVCIACIVVTTAVSLAFLTLSLLHIASVWPWYALVALGSVASGIAAPSYRSILPQLTGQERFGRVAAAVTSASQFIAILGPALAGLLIAFSTSAAFATLAACNALSVAAFAALRSQPRGATSSDESTLAHAAGGLRYLFSQPVVLGAISLDLFAVLFGGATALLPIVATSILHIGSIGFGILRAAPAIGAGMMAFVLARRPLERHAGPKLFLCVAAFGVGTIVFGLSRNVMLSFVALVAIGAFDMVSVVVRMLLVQMQTPNELRGRVSAIDNIFIGASNELGAFESGSVAALFGATTSIIFGGVMTLAVIGLWCVLFPALRRYDRINALADSA